MVTENELQHWGIFGMKWGVRNYQNPDGTLTPAGRERYGVGPARKTRKLTVHDIPDEELKNMTNRLFTEGKYLEARNRYIESEIRYAQLTAKPKKFQNVKRFFDNIFGKSITNVLQQDVEFALKVQGAQILDQMGSEYTKDYLNYVLKRNDNKKKNKNKNYNDNDDDD